MSTSVLRVQLGSSGSLLDVRLLGDDAQSTIDSKTAAAPTAFSKFTALRATSTVLNDPTTSKPLDLTLSALESRQPGGQAEVNQSSVDLANPGVPVLTGLGDIISGNLNLAKLTSSVDASTAKSTLNAGLADAAVAGALLTADAIGSTVESTTSNAQTSSTRGVNVDAISVLDLGALLDGLDIDITHLTPSQVSGLLETLDVSIPNVDADATLEGLIEDVNSQINDLQAAITGGTGLTEPVQDVVDLLGLGDVIPQEDIDAITGTAVEQANLLIDTLQAALAEVISSALSTLDATSLLHLDGVDVDVATKATDALSGSSAAVTGTIGTVKVGNVSLLPALDLVATAETVNNTVTEINNTLSDALATISTPITGGEIDLSDLVTVEVLKKTSSVATNAAGYNVASAGITGLTAKVTPPVDLAALITAIKTQNTGGQSAGALLTGLGGTVPALDDAMGDLEALLGQGIQALQGGATITAVEVAGVSEFRAATTTGAPGGPTLAETGMSDGTKQLTALGLLLVAFGLGLGRWFKMPTPAWVRRRF